MELENSPLMNEIDKVIEDGEKRVFYYYYAEFKIKDTFPGEIKYSKRDEETALEEELNDLIFKPLKLLNYDTERDYEKAYGDYVKLRVVIPYGLWVKVLFPARDHLYCTIKRVPARESTYEVIEDEDIEEYMFDCLPQMTEDLQVEVSRYNMVDKFELDNTVQPLEVEFELLDRGLEDLRKLTVGAIIRKATPEDAVKVLLAENTEELEIEDTKVVETISIVEADNEEEREHILIPHATKLIDTPNYIHKKCGGFYNSGINTYYQNKGLYVYPIYNTDRFEDEEKTLTVVKVPENRLTGIERTFKLDGERLTILATSESKFIDFNKGTLLRDGSGVRYGDSRKFMNKITETKDNKSIIKRKETNHEYISKDIEEQNTVFLSSNRIHSNPFQEFSVQASRNAGLYTFVWDNADINLLYPGMPVRVLYSDNDDILELRGVLLKTHAAVQAAIPGLAPSGHQTQAALFIFAALYDGE
jgi:hypothetical protein